MTLQLSNLPFNNNDLSEDIAMNALAQQLNAIEPSAGLESTIENTTANLAPQIIGLDSPLSMVLIFGLVIGSLAYAFYIKPNLKLSKASK